MTNHAVFLIATMLFAVPAHAQGDVTLGEEAFAANCKSCHMISSPDETIVRGGRTGPNLYGVVGRVAGSVDKYRYGKGLRGAQEAGFVWTVQAIENYVADPKAWLGDQGFDTQSKMGFKLKSGRADVAEYLATFSQ